MAIETRSWGWTGVRVPKLGQGTWKMEQDDAPAALEALRAGLDAGLSHVDTAELYGSGRVEELVGQALAGRRDEVFLVSKVQPSNASRKGTVQACDRSLRRLKTDHLDCYLLHWPGSHPLEDTIASFEELIQAGKIRSWGLSNFDVSDLEAALRIAGPRRIACNQVLYHLQARDIEAEVLPWCTRHEVAVVGYSPFRSRALPTALQRRWQASGQGGGSQRSNSLPGGAGLPGPRPERVRHSQGGGDGPRPVQRQSRDVDALSRGVAGAGRGLSSPHRTRATDSLGSARSAGSPRR